MFVGAWHAWGASLFTRVSSHPVSLHSLAQSDQPWVNAGVFYAQNASRDGGLAWVGLESGRFDEISTRSS